MGSYDDSGDFEKALDETAVLLIEGLMTDGAHHKQAAMEEALRAFCGDKFVDGAKEEFQWEDGIPA